MGHKALIRRHMAVCSREIGLDWFITIPFTHLNENGRISRANKNDIPALFGLVNTYANLLAVTVHGRCRGERPLEKWVPFIAIPEYMKRKNDMSFAENDKTHPHWHCMIKLPDSDGLEIIKLSFEFWRKQGLKHCGLPVIPHFEPMYDVEGASGYSTKWLDEQTTLEYAIFRGIKLRLESKT